MKLSTIYVCLAFGLATSTIRGAAVASDTSSHLRSSRKMIDLDNSGIRECTRDEPCGECQGDCDTDEDCSGSLICHNRNVPKNEDDAKVPGCGGRDYSKTDWCVSAGAEEKDDSGGDQEGNSDADPDILAGFDSGMSTDVVGLWVGEEKWPKDGTIDTFCTSAIFQPTDTGNFCNWHPFYLGNETETCEDIGVYPKTGGVNNPEYFKSFGLNYFLSVDYKTCLTEADCSYDVTTSEGYEDYEVIDSSCGAHLKKGITNVWFTCELYQVNRLQKNDGTGEPIDVVILTYSSWFEGGYANFICPNKPTYDLEELEDDPNAQGATRFVLQSGGASNTSDWECLV